MKVLFLKGPVCGVSSVTDDSLCFFPRLEGEKKSKSFISLAEVAGRLAVIEQFCDQTGTTIHVGLNRALHPTAVICVF